MVVDVYGLLTTNDYDTEMKVGRFYVVSAEEVDKLIKMMDNMARKVPERKQYISEYRWEKVK